MMVRATCSRCKNTWDLSTDAPATICCQICGSRLLSLSEKAAVLCAICNQVVLRSPKNHEVKIPTCCRERLHVLNIEQEPKPEPMPDLAQEIPEEPEQLSQRTFKKRKA